MYGNRNFKNYLLLSSVSEMLPLNKSRELHDCVLLNKLIRFEIFLKDIPRISKWTKD